MSSEYLSVRSTAFRRNRGSYKIPPEGGTTNTHLELPSGWRMSENGPHLLLYDGPCGLCNRIVQAVLKHDRNGVFYFAALQSRIAEKWVDSDPTDTVIVISNYQSSQPVKLTKSRAALFVLSALGWPWKMAGIFRFLPSSILDITYDLIARNRHRFVSPSDTCLVPPPESQHRFPG